MRAYLRILAATKAILGGLVSPLILARKPCARGTLGNAKNGVYYGYPSSRVYSRPTRRYIQGKSVPLDRYVVDSNYGCSETVPLLILRPSSCRMRMLMTKKRHTSALYAWKIGFRDYIDWIDLNFFGDP